MYFVTLAQTRIGTPQIISHHGGLRFSNHLFDIRQTFDERMRLLDTHQETNHQGGISYYFDDSGMFTCRGLTRRCYLLTLRKTRTDFRNSQVRSLGI
jgi:hypothetical protein